METETLHDNTHQQTRSSNLASTYSTGRVPVWIIQCSIHNSPKSVFMAQLAELQLQHWEQAHLEHGVQQQQQPFCSDESRGSSLRCTEQDDLDSRDISTMSAFAAPVPAVYAVPLDILDVFTPGDWHYVMPACRVYAWGSRVGCSNTGSFHGGSTAQLPAIHVATLLYDQPGLQN